MISSKRVPTGIFGLDELIEGGFPEGRCILICGGPGTGKTILATQFLFNGAVKHNEAGVFIAFDENIGHIRDAMQRFGWDLEELERQKKLAFVDLSEAIYLSPEEFKQPMHMRETKAPEFSVKNVIVTLRDYIEALKAKRIVVDSLTALVAQEQDLAKNRRNIGHLFRALLDTGCTCLLTSEIRASALEREFQFEEYLAQGAIVLQTIAQGNKLVRSIRIEKMRGTAPDLQPRPYNIGQKGLEVFPEEIVIFP